MVSVDHWNIEKFDGLFLIDGIRTPFGRFGGQLRSLSAIDLGVEAIRGLMHRSGIDYAGVMELFVGMAMIEGGEFVPARQIAMRAGFPEALPTLTLDRACCSGLTAAAFAARASKAKGPEGVAIALGVEAMSQVPRLLRNSRWDSRRGDLQVEDPLLMRSPVAGKPIAVYTGEEALKWGVGREDQDQWALRSHQRYFSAAERGYFDDEIVAVQAADTFVDRDESPRSDTSYEKLAALPCVYGSPTITAGNAPGTNDGAAALLLGGEEAARVIGRPPLARLHSYIQIAGQPTSAVALPGIAIRQLTSAAGLEPQDLSVIEINEAFAATPVVSAKTLAGVEDPELLKVIRERTNMNGGAVALGHPTGASGARILLTAARQLEMMGGGWAAVAICGGFGQTDAMLLQGVSL